MNKKELVASIAQKTNMSLNASEIALNGVLDSIIETIQKGEVVTLVGFGTFTIKEHMARTGYNPATKAPMQIPAKKMVRFKAGNKLELKSK